MRIDLLGVSSAGGPALYVDQTICCARMSKTTSRELSAGSIAASYPRVASGRDAVSPYSSTSPGRW